MLFAGRSARLPPESLLVSVDLTTYRLQNIQRSMLTRCLGIEGILVGDNTEQGGQSKCRNGKGTLACILHTACPYRHMAHDRFAFQS